MFSPPNTFSEFEDCFQVGLTMIHPDYQNKGIATKIISSYIDIAKAKKNRIIIKTFKENPAQRLYQRLGFSIVCEYPGVFDVPCYRMIKKEN